MRLESSNQQISNIDGNCKKRRYNVRSRKPAIISPPNMRSAVDQKMDSEADEEDNPPLDFLMNRISSEDIRTKIISYLDRRSYLNCNLINKQFHRDCSQPESFHNQSFVIELETLYKNPMNELDFHAKLQRYRFSQELILELWDPRAKKIEWEDLGNHSALDVLQLMKIPQLLQIFTRATSLKLEYLSDLSHSLFTAENPNMFQDHPNIQSFSISCSFLTLDSTRRNLAPQILSTLRQSSSVKHFRFKSLILPAPPPLY